MDMIVFCLVLFAVNVSVIELLIYFFRSRKGRERVRIQKRLRKYSYVPDNQGAGDILKKRIFSDIPLADSLLRRFPGVLWFDRLVVQANGQYPLGIYILAALLIATVGYQVGGMLDSPLWVCILIFFIGLLSPFLYLTAMKMNRRNRFIEQFPEGLGLIGRTLRAGHAFSNSIKLASEQFDDPLGPEFAEMLDEINFGVSVSDALKHMADRIDCPEIKFFIIGVIIQRESGGNLAELIDSLAHLIRQKFKFKRNLKTLTAEVRLSSVVLSIMPFVIVLFVYYLNPSYLDPLIHDPIGRVITICSSITMVLGLVVMKLMVRIDV